MSVMEEIVKYLIQNPERKVIFSVDTDIQALRFVIYETKEAALHYADFKYIPIKDLLDIGDPDNVIRFWFDQMTKEMDNYGRQ